MLWKRISLWDIKKKNCRKAIYEIYISIIYGTHLEGYNRDFHSLAKTTAVNYIMLPKAPNKKKNKKTMTSYLRITLVTFPPRESCIKYKLYLFMLLVSCNIYQKFEREKKYILKAALTTWQQKNNRGWQRETSVMRTLNQISSPPLTWYHCGIGRPAYCTERER